MCKTMQAEYKKKEMSHCCKYHSTQGWQRKTRLGETPRSTPTPGYSIAAREQTPLPTSVHK